MYFANALLLAGTALAAAAPSTYEPKKASYPGTFEVSNFSFGCTVSCAYSFDLTVKGKGPNHPAVKGKKVTCKGDLTETDYVQCGKKISKTQTLNAYIDAKANNTLRLEYVVQEPKKGATYRWNGKKVVYAQTGPNAEKQTTKFSVKESSASAVA